MKVTILLVVVALLWLLSASRKRARAAMVMAPGFAPAQVFLGAKSALAVDAEGTRICLGEFAQPPRFIGPDQLVAVDVVEDGESVTRTDRLSQHMSALSGAIDHGRPGAVIGALTSKTVTRQVVNRLDLKLTIDDLARPVHVVGFLSGSARKDSATYRSAAGMVEHWQGVMTTLMHRAHPTPGAPAPGPAPDEAAGAPTGETASPVPSSVADELLKLASLVEKGLLSEAEFRSQKRKLLGG